MLENLCLTAPPNYDEPVTLETLLNHGRFPRLHTLSIDHLDIWPPMQTPSLHTITDLSLHLVRILGGGLSNLSRILSTCSNLVTLTLNLRSIWDWERYVNYTPQILPRLKVLNCQGPTDQVPVFDILSTPTLEELHFTIDGDQRWQERDILSSLPSLSRINSKPFTFIEFTGDALDEHKILALLVAFPNLTTVTLSHMTSIELFIQSLMPSRSLAPRLESLVLDTIGCFRNAGQQLGCAVDLVELIRSRAASVDCSNITTLLLRNVRLYEGVPWPEKLAALDGLHVDIQEEGAR